MTKITENEIEPLEKVNTTKAFSNFVIFKVENTKINIDVLFQDETLWLTQRQIADIYALCTNHDKNIK